MAIVAAFWRGLPFHAIYFPITAMKIMKHWRGVVTSASSAAKSYFNDISAIG